MPTDDEPVETGLLGFPVTATVTEKPRFDTVAPPTSELPQRAADEARALAPAITQMPDGWTLAKVAGLVRDVAQAMYDEPYILKKHALTPAQYEFLKKNEFFQHALEAETISWQRADNVKNRLALEAAIAVEDALPTVAARLSKSTEPLSDVVALLKVLSEIAGTIGTKAAGPQANSEKFKIVINLGADTVQREATAPLVTVSERPEIPQSRDPVQSLLEATGMSASVQTDR